MRRSVLACCSFRAAFVALVIAAAVVLTAAVQAQVDDSRTRRPSFLPLVYRAGAHYRVDPRLLDAVIQIESAYRSDATSSAGAVGLMHLMEGDPLPPPSREEVEVAIREITPEQFRQAATGARQVSLTSESLRRLQARRLEIDASEPPVYRVLDAVCHDELITALGLDTAYLHECHALAAFLPVFADVGASRLQKAVDSRSRV